MRGISTLFTGKNSKFYFLFLGLSFCLYLPACFFRTPFFPDEARIIYIVQNIKNFPDFFVPQYLGDFYWEKPPLYFWILKSFVSKDFRLALFVTTTINVLFSWAILSLNYLLFKKAGKPKQGFLSSLLLATSGLFFAMTILTRMDIMFCFFIFASIFSVWQAVNTGKLKYFYLYSLFSFLAVFTKGALGFIFPLIMGVAATLIIPQRMNRLKRVLYMNLFTFLVIMIWLAGFNLVNDEYFQKMVFGQTVARGINPTTKQEPFYFYLLMVIPIMLPWSLLGCGSFLSWKKIKTQPIDRFMLVWFSLGLLILSLISSKTPMYLLVLAFPFASLSALYFIEGPAQTAGKAVSLTAGIFFGLVFAGLIVCFFIKQIVPLSAYAICFLLAVLSFKIGKYDKRKKMTAFIVSWIFILELINLSVFPLVSSSSKYARLSKLSNNLEKDIKKIYVQENKFLLLNVVANNKEFLPLPAIDDFCENSNVGLISQQESLPCAAEKIAQVKKYKIWLRQ
ncbi:MAG: glycosyltransferase family 39 protein [Candidatus Omnitrophica bacterium]|nr:glycosyltransferase family 39 protein [Candidatus Omnitrophota bacterium]